MQRTRARRTCQRSLLCRVTHFRFPPGPCAVSLSTFRVAQRDSDRTVNQCHRDEPNPSLTSGSHPGKRPFTVTSTQVLLLLGRRVGQLSLPKLDHIDPSRMNSQSVFPFPDPMRCLWINNRRQISVLYHRQHYRYPSSASTLGFITSLCCCFWALSKSSRSEDMDIGELSELQCSQTDQDQALRATHYRREAPHHFDLCALFHPLDHLPVPLLSSVLEG